MLNCRVGQNINGSDPFDVADPFEFVGFSGRLGRWAGLLIQDLDTAIDQHTPLTRIRH